MGPVYEQARKVGGGFGSCFDFKYVASCEALSEIGRLGRGRNGCTKPSRLKIEGTDRVSTLRNSSILLDERSTDGFSGFRAMRNWDEERDKTENVPGASTNA